jgi:hypothetical protein
VTPRNISSYVHWESRNITEVTFIGELRNITKEHKPLTFVRELRNTLTFVRELRNIGFFLKMPILSSSLPREPSKQA